MRQIRHDMRTTVIVRNRTISETGCVACDPHGSFLCTALHEDIRGEFQIRLTTVSRPRSIRYAARDWTRRFANVFAFLAMPRNFKRTDVTLPLFTGANPNSDMSRPAMRSTSAISQGESSMRQLSFVPLRKLSLPIFATSNGAFFSLAGLEILDVALIDIPLTLVPARRDAQPMAKIRMRVAGPFEINS